MEHTPYITMLKSSKHQPLAQHYGDGWNLKPFWRSRGYKYHLDTGHATALGDSWVEIQFSWGIGPLNSHQCASKSQLFVMIFRKIDGHFQQF